jgi:tungstate transport system permease protein
VATAIAMLIGIPAGTWLALARRRGKRLLATFVNTGMAIPTVVIGLLVALLLWRSGPLGSENLIYTLRGMVIAQVLIAAPLITGITMAAIQLLPPELPDQLRVMGAGRLQLVVRLWLEARIPLLAAVMAGFGHAISEVGSATIVGGNIHGQTQVLTTAIVEDVGKGDFGPALGYAAVLIGLALVVNGLLTSVQQRGAAWARS